MKTRRRLIAALTLLAIMLLVAFGSLVSSHRDDVTPVYIAKDPGGGGKGRANLMDADGA